MSRIVKRTEHRERGKCSLSSLFQARNRQARRSLFLSKSCWEAGLPGSTGKYCSCRHHPCILETKSDYFFLPTSRPSQTTSVLRHVETGQLGLAVYPHIFGCFLGIPLVLTSKVKPGQTSPLEKLQQLQHKWEFSTLCFSFVTSSPGIRKVIFSCSRGSSIPQKPVSTCVFPTVGRARLSLSSYLLESSPESLFENHSEETGQLFKNDSCSRGINWPTFFWGKL